MSLLKKFAFYLDVVEHDSWSGAASDGIMLFLSEEESDEFIKEKYAGRGGATPEYYVNYEKGAYIPVGNETYKKIKKNKQLHLESKAKALE